jgi:hypothetical protein
MDDASIGILPELHKYLVEDVDGHYDLRHPLLYFSIYSAETCEQANRRCLQKKAEAQQALSAKDWRGYVRLHERPYRLRALRRCHRAGLHGEHYWEQVSSVWRDTENAYQHKADWLKVWSADEPDRWAVMNEGERLALAKMPERFPVWRGVRDKRGNSGLSWTTDRDKAIWFANRFKSPKALLLAGVVTRSDVWAMFATPEREVVSAKVAILSATSIKDAKPTNKP